MADEVKNEEVATGQDKKSGLTLVVIIVAVVILVQLIAVAFIIISVRSKGDVSKTHPQAETETTQETPTQEFAQLSFSEPIALLVNVKGTGGDRYFKASLIIEYNAVLYPQFSSFITTNLPRFTDIAINVLSARNINVLDNPEARNNIRVDLITEFSKIVPEGVGKINNILITEWLIQ